MNNPQSQRIVLRFFSALDRLKEEKVIRGYKSFTERYNINRWNMITISKDPASNMFQVGWLENLVLEYKVSARWLLTGEGEFYQEGWNTELVTLALDNFDGGEDALREINR